MALTLQQVRTLPAFADMSDSDIISHASSNGFDTSAMMPADRETTGTLAAYGQTLKQAVTQIPGYVASAIEGSTPYDSNNLLDATQAKAKASQHQFEGGVDSQDPTFGGLANVADIKQIAPSLAGSITGMAPTMAGAYAGAALGSVAGPAGTVIGGAAGGIIGAGLGLLGMKRAAENQFVKDNIAQENTNRAAQGQAPLSPQESIQFQDTLNATGDTAKMGYAEALPETFGNLIEAAVLATPIGKFGKSLSTIGSPLAKALTAGLIKGAATVATEAAEEEATRQLQNPIMQRHGFPEQTAGETLKQTAIATAPFAALGFGTGAYQSTKKPAEKVDPNNQQQTDVNLDNNLDLRTDEQKAQDNASVINTDPVINQDQAIQTGLQGTPNSADAALSTQSENLNGSQESTSETQNTNAQEEGLLGTVASEQLGATSLVDNAPHDPLVSVIDRNTGTAFHVLQSDLDSNKERLTKHSIATGKRLETPILRNDIVDEQTYQQELADQQQRQDEQANQQTETQAQDQTSADQSTAVTFQPTHTLEDGTPVISHGIGEGFWNDKEGNGHLSFDAKPIGKVDTATTDTSAEGQGNNTGPDVPNYATAPLLNKRTNQPFTTQKLAEAAIASSSNPTVNQQDHIAVPVDGGFGIVPKPNTTQGNNDTATETQSVLSNTSADATGVTASATNDVAGQASNATAQEVKQPWEMTDREYGQHKDKEHEARRLENLAKVDADLDTLTNKSEGYDALIAKETARVAHTITPEGKFSHNLRSGSRVYNSAHDFVHTQLYKRWKNTESHNGKFRSSFATDDWTHLQAIQKAIDTGKTIPQNVLDSLNQNAEKLKYPSAQETAASNTAPATKEFKQLGLAITFAAKIGNRTIDDMPGSYNQGSEHHGIDIHSINQVKDANGNTDYIVDVSNHTRVASNGHKTVDGKYSLNQLLSSGAISQKTHDFFVSEHDQAANASPETSNDHELTAQQYVDRENKSFPGNKKINDTLRKSHYTAIRSHADQGGKISQEVFDSLDGLKRTNLKNNYGEGVVKAPVQETANTIHDNADVSKKGENVDTYHQQTIDEFLSDAKKELGADFDGLKPSLINEHYQAIEDHIKDGGKISQAVYDSLESGKQHHFNKSFGAENVIDDGTRQAELDKLNKISDAKLAKDNEAKAQEEKEFADKKNAVAIHQADETVRMAQYDVDHYGASESNQLKLDQAIKSRDALVRADNATATENGNTAKPEWHIDIPEQGLAILPAELKGEGYRTVAGRIAKDAVEAITQNQKIANDTLYLYILPAAENYNAIARYFPEDQKPGGSWQISDSQGVRAGSLTNDQLLYKTESIMGNKPILGWEKTSTDAVNVIGKGNSGDVTRIDNEVEKNATGNEAKVYELFKGVEGVAKGYEHDGKIRLPFYEHIISIDTIPKDDRESLGSLVSKNKDRIISAVNSLTNIGYDYNDPLQFGMNKDQQFDLLDFSMAENNSPKEVRNNNLNRLSSFFKQFGAEKIGKAISHVANVLTEQKFQAQYPDMAYTTHEGIDYPALTERLGGKVATHAYYATNARYIQLKDTGIAQTELVNGIKVILSNHAISESDIKQWEMTSVVYGSITKQEKVAQTVKPTLGKYIQPKATASAEDQKRLANRGSRIATLSGLNEAVRKSNPDHAYSDSEIQSAADEKIDAGIDWLISKQQPTERLTTKGTVVADKAESNIQDFGEKLEGAKKFTYTFKEALAEDIDISAVPLSKSFPQPDYDKLIAGGIEPQVAALIAQLRAEIPTKPSKSYRVSKWVAQVTAIREAADSLLNGDLTVERFIQAGKDKDNYTKYMGDVLAIADSILPSQIRELGNFKLEHALYGLHSGVKDVWKWSVVNTASKSSWGKQFDTKEEAIAYIKSEISTENAKGESIAKFDRWTERGKPGVVFVGKKIASGKYITLKEFPTSKEALNYTIEHNAELVELLKQKKKDKEVRRSENNQRVGKDYRSLLFINRLIKSLENRANISAELVSNSLISHSRGSKSNGKFIIPPDSVLSDSPSGVDADLNKSFPYMAAVNLKFLGYLNNAGTLDVQAFSKLDIPFKRLVQSAMLSIGHDEQIRRAVVLLIPVDVMNNLAAEKISANNLLSNKSMLSDSLSINGEMPVRSINPAILSFIRAVASVGTEITGTNNPAWVSFKDNSTALTGQFDGIFGKSLFSHNVTPDDFIDAFSFFGVQFGNYVSNDRRQQDLNNAYDGLIDLAEVLGIPPKALALNGELGLAFGARGTGGEKAAAAHYEANQVVINLTKAHGAGSLAHEWWHAVDNYFGKQEGSGFLSDKGPRRAQILDGNKYRESTDSDFAVRKEVFDAWQGITKAIKTETQLAKRSAIKDKTRSKDYYSTVIEMTARTFERYIIGKLADQGYENDYLANIIPAPILEKESELDNEDYAYPLQSEMAAVNKAYDKLFDILETKETEKGTALFSKASILSDNAKPDGITESQANAAIEIFKRDFGNIDGVKFKVYKTLSDAVGETEAKKIGRVKGFYLPNSKTIAIIRDALHHVQDAAETLRHETLGHFGLNLLRPADKLAFLGDIARSKNNLFLREMFAEVVRNYPELANDEFMQAEEVFAKVAEEQPSELTQWLDKQLLKLLGLFRKIGLLKGYVTKTDMRDMAKSLAEGIRRGDSQKTFPKNNHSQFSKSAIPKLKVNLSDVTESGGHFATGVPVTFKYVHNTASYTALLGKKGKPPIDSPYGRGYEPSGQFLTVVGRHPAERRSEMEYGEVTFNNPLVIDNDSLNWKKQLSDSFGGKTGKYLSEAVIKAGYDGIVTTENGHTSEVVNLTNFDKSIAKYSKSTTPVVNPHSKTSLNQAVTKAMDTLFGQGWTNRLMATGKFKMISAAEATGLIGKNAMFHKVWHGSPHDHNGFDSANIGTGEGAQAFGWGHYFSDAKKIAEWYRDKLSFHGGAELYYSNEFDRFKEEYPDLGNEFEYWARESYGQHTLSNGDVGALLRKVIANPRNNFLTSNEEEDQLINLNNKIKDTNFKVKEYTYGKLYEVDLAPNQDEYLDWDKPLSQQSDVVKAGLKELHKQLEGDQLNEYLDRINADWSELTGQELYQKILDQSHQDGLFDHPDIYDRSVPNDEASSHLLHSLGIRGIRYKAEQGQSEANNYVVFNDADVKIEVKYSKNGDVIAFYNPADDTTYLVHDNITQNTSDKAIQGLLLHEIGVHALTLGKSNEVFKDILRRFEALKATNPKVQAAFARVPKGTKAEDIVEEALAYYLEENPKSSLAQRIVEWFRQAVRALGKTLPVLERAKFSQWANKLTEAELIGMATSALKSAPDSLQFDNVGRNREGIKLSGDNKKLLAPNGKPSNLNAMQHAQVRTEAFKKWFGDWEVALNNKIINEQIKQYENGELPANVILNIGNPSGLLQDHGIPNLPIKLRQSIIRKAVKIKHEIDFSDLNNIAISIQAPIAIFDDPDHTGTRIAITELRHADGNIMAAIRLNIAHDGLEINDIRSIHPKRDESIIRWVESGHLLGLDKTKGRSWLENLAATSSRQPQVQVASDDSILYDAEYISKSSKVVDENGEPLVVYHGTNGNFDTFEPSSSGMIFFTDNKDSAMSFGYPNYPDPIAVYLKIHTLASDENVVKIAEKIGTRNLDESEPIRTVEENKKLLDVMRKEGFDGLKMSDSAMDAGKFQSYIAFNPNQIKSATENNGDFSESNNNIKFSRSTPSNTPADNSAIRDMFKKVKDNPSLEWLGQLFTRNQLIEFIANEVPKMMGYKKLSQQKDNALHGREQEIAEQYEAMNDLIRSAATDSKKLPGFRTDYAKARRLMNELSRAQSLATNLDTDFDPADHVDKDFMTKEEREAFDAYDVLPDELKSVYKTMRKDYRDDMDETRKALLANLDRFPIDSKAKAAIVAEINAHFDQALSKGVYFPLARFGNIIVTGTNPQGEFVSAFVKGNTARDKMITDMEAQGYTKVHSQEKEEYDADLIKGNVAHTMAALAKNTVDDIRAKMQQGQAVEDDIDQMLADFHQELIRALPDTAYRKHFLHRKGTLGESGDTLRAYANTRTSSAKNQFALIYDYQIAKVLTDSKQEIAKLRSTSMQSTDFLDSVMKEIGKREQALKANDIAAWAQLATSLGFMGALGYNIASAGVNMLQVVGIGLPELSGRHGFGKSSAAITHAYQLILNRAVLNKHSGFDLMKNPAIKQLTKAALQHLHDIGKIDLTMTHDSIAASKNPSYSSNQVNRAVGVLAKKSGYLFHVAEALNRQVMGIAAFELELAKNGGDYQAALIYAEDVIDNTQYDYGPGNRARFMMGDTARVITLFKAYAIQTSWFIGRNAYQWFKGLEPEERLAARKTLLITMAMSFATAGLFGMPIGTEAFAGVGGVAGFKYKGAKGAIAGAAGGVGASMLASAAIQALLVGLGADDDDDIETQFRNWLTDNLNQSWAEFVTKGPARFLVPGDIAGRTGLSHLWYQPQNKELEGRDKFNQVANTLMGPVASQAANLVAAQTLWADGEQGRAIEMMSPRALANMLAAHRMAEKGVTTLKGDKIIQRELTDLELLSKAIGFNPSVITNAYDANSAIAKESTKHTLAKSHLVNRWISGDATERSDLMKGAIKDFNESVPPSERITLKSLFKSMRSRKGIDKHTKNGLYLSKKQNYLRDIGRFNRQE